MKKQGFTVWIFGLPFSGKKQLASLLSAKLESLGCKTEILEGGKIRRQFDQKLGYSKEEVYQNIRRICYECKMLTENEVVKYAVDFPHQSQGLCFWLLSNQLLST